jgi:hypothetical protein
MDRMQMQALRRDGNALRQTWYVDGEFTHGIPGLACVTNDGPHPNVIGIGPDMTLEGLSAMECVAALVGMGFDDLDTDVVELRTAWEEQ